jgi:hypothetical protein
MLTRGQNAAGLMLVVVGVSRLVVVDSGGPVSPKTAAVAAAAPTHQPAAGQGLGSQRRAKPCGCVVPGAHGCFLTLSNGPCALGGGFVCMRLLVSIVSNDFCVS